MKPTRKYTGTMPRTLEELAGWTGQRLEPALEPQLPIVDPHHHLWHDERGRYLADDYLAEVASSGHNVVATVYVQFRSRYRQHGPDELKPVGEVEFASRIAADSVARGDRTRLCEGIVAHADLLLGDRAHGVLDALVEAGKGRLRAVRHSASWDSGVAATGRKFSAPGMLRDAGFRRGFAGLAPRGLAFDAWLFYHQLPDLIDLLRAFPDTPVVLDHAGGVLGLPPHSDRRAVFEIWRKHMRELSYFPNLSVKLGGLGMLYSGWEFQVGDMPPDSAALARAWGPYLEACIEDFGAGRCMFESNFPVDKQTCGYGELWNAFKRVTRDCSAEEKSRLYAGTAARIYGLRALGGDRAT